MAEPAPGAEPEPDAVPASQVWDAVCRHIDGMAIGSTMAALSSRGALPLLATADRTEFGKLRAALGAHAGFLHVAVRLLADQGWVTCAGEGGTDELTITPTASGRVVMTVLAEGYTEAARSLPLAARIAFARDGAAGSDAAAGSGIAAAGRDLEPFLDLARRDWDLPAAGVPAEVRHQVLAHLDGHLIAPVMVALTRGNAAVPAGNAAVPAGPAAGLLARQGWAHPSSALTPSGRIAFALAKQYRYPMVYLPLLRSVPELIFGDPSCTAPSDEAEVHLDRDLDLRFSGEVFAALCRAPFLQIALPLFDREPVAAQPALVVDTGCGDGTLLETLYTAIRTQTRRGQRLGDHPLLMVGADPSPVARKMAAARLAAAGVPHLIMDGDIAGPAGLARELAAAGHDASDALHVCKSAIHDRAYHPPAAAPPPATTSPPAAAPPAALTAFALPDGTAIPATRMALNLADMFRDWQPLARKHGWIVIEAHSVPAGTAATLIGRTLATALDATHGYSCQYPVEPGVFAWAARAGGFTSRAHHEPGAAALGHTQLTIDHFVVPQ